MKVQIKIKVKVQIKIKDNIKIKQEADHVNKQTQNANIRDTPRTNTQNKNNPWNANIPSPIDLPHDSYQSIVAEGVFSKKPHRVCLEYFPTVEVLRALR